MAFGDGLADRASLTRCKVCLFLLTLGDDRTAAEALFADPDYSAAELAAEVERCGGPSMDESSVKRHRQRHVPGWKELSGVR